MADFNIIKQALSNVSIAYETTGIAEQIFPVVRVGKSSAPFYTFDKSNLRTEDDVRADKTPSNEVNFDLSTGTYTLLAHALHGKVSEKDRQNAAGTGVDPEAAVVRQVTSNIMQRKEGIVKTRVFGTANYSSGQKAALTGNLQWGISTISNPIAQIASGMTQVVQKIGKEPNVMVMGREVFDKLLVNDAIVDRMKHTSGGSVTEELLATLFRVSKVLIGSHIVNSAEEGISDSLAFTWGKKVALLYVEQTPGLMLPTFGYEFSRTAGRIVRTWFSEELNCDIFEVEDEYDIKIVDGDAGYILDNVVL